jgi:hypothetical protein
MKEELNSSTWSVKPESGTWTDTKNWQSAEVPSDKAIFSSTSQTQLVFTQGIAAEIRTIEFNTNAPAYTILFENTADDPDLTISGEGVVNNSPCIQSFMVASTGVSHDKPQLKFSNTASAGGSNNFYSAGPTSLGLGYGGGIIGFTDKATAGSANFTVRTGAIPPPKENSTVGGEVSFSDSSTASTAQFTIFGTLGTDGDTFGNVVFHDNATADRALFTNMGGTVSGGDGGNTQFYNNSNAAYGTYYNFGGVHEKANGGDVAFDGNATGGYGQFYNMAATAYGAYGGVTSFNNNPPDMESLGATAGNGTYHNLGAREDGDGGGGHTEFTAKHGSPTAGNGTFINYGSAIGDKSSAGHTIFSINLPSVYFPTADNAIFWNHPGVGNGCAAGYTEFAVWSDNDDDTIAANVPTAGNATFHNIGATVSGAYGGYTSFADNTTAFKANLIAYGGSNGGYGGKVAFYDDSVGGASKIELTGNGELDVSYHNTGLTISSLSLTEGVIKIEPSSDYNGITVVDELVINSETTSFYFEGDDIKANMNFALLTASNMSDFSIDRFTGNNLNGMTPEFSINGDTLFVQFQANN